MNGLFGRVSWVIGMVLVLIGVVVVVGGVIPIPYPKLIQEERIEAVDVDGSIQPRQLNITIQAGTKENITYTLKNGTILRMELLKSNIDFYITDSVGNVLFNEGRLIGDYSLPFEAPKDDNFTLYFDNTFDKVNNKTIPYRVVKAFR